MSDELLDNEGVSRRSMLKKSALVGGTMVWAAPVVSSFTSPAFGQTDGTGLVGDKGISYIAIAYSCGGEGTRYVKFDEFSGAQGSESYNCTTGKFETPGCSFADNSGESEDAYPEDCALFTVTYDLVEDGEPTVITVTIGGEECIIEATALAKCGAPENEQSGGECVPPTVANDTSVTFSDCGV